MAKVPSSVSGTKVLQASDLFISKKFWSLQLLAATNNVSALFNYRLEQQAQI
jgi:hypothetical protein